MATKTVCDICGKELIIKVIGGDSLTKFQSIPCSKVTYLYSNGEEEEDYCADCTEKIMHLVYERTHRYGKVKNNDGRNE